MSGYDALMGKGPAQASDNIEQPQAAPAVEAPPAPEPQPTGETVSATPPAQEQVSPPAPVAQEAAPPAATQREWTVPGQTLLSEREKRQATERRLAEAQRRLDEIERREAEAAAVRPDPLVDQEAFWAHLDQLVEQRVTPIRSAAEADIARVRVNTSERYWSAQLGAEEWGQFNDWLRSLPADARADLKRYDDPYGTALPRYQEWKTFDTLGGKTPQAWAEEQFEAMAAARGYVSQAQLQAQQPVAQPVTAPQAQVQPPQAQPRRQAPSLAEVVGVTATQNAPVSGYDALFKR